MKDKKNIWIIGAGGIGLAIANAYQKQGDEVWLISSKAQNEKGLNTVLLHHLDEEGINHFIKRQPIPDEVVLSAGLLHQDTDQPEKSILQLERNWLMKSMDANVLPTMLWCKYLTQMMKSSDTVKVASLSARVSSVSDNRLGGWHSYRMSKAALNMLIKNISIEWAMKYPTSCIIGYHPGTVDTLLSKPFQANVKKESLFSAEKAANYFISVFAKKQPQDSGQLFDWQDKTIPF